MLLQEIKTRLAALTPTVGPIYRGYMPETPDVCVMLRKYQGVPPQTGFGVEGIQFEMPGVQVFVRGIPDDSDGPELRAERIYQDLAKVQAATLSGTRYLMIRPQQSPFRLPDPDTKRRVTWVFNALCEKEPSATA